MGRGSEPWHRPPHPSRVNGETLREEPGMGERAGSAHSTAELGRGSAAMGRREQPHARALCRLQMCATNPSHVQQAPGCGLCWSCSGPSSTRGCREGETSRDGAVGNSKGSCWSLLWPRPGYPAWQPNHCSETLSTRQALEDQRKNSSRPNFSFKPQKLLPSLEVHSRVQSTCDISEAPCSVSSSSSPFC